MTQLKEITPEIEKYRSLAEDIRTRMMEASQRIFDALKEDFPGAKS